jgi:hypothetical protein
MGFMVLTEDEYLDNLGRFDRIIIAQSNRKVNEWNQRVSDVYMKRGQKPSVWQSDIFQMSTSKGTPIKDLFDDGPLRQVIVAAIREDIVVVSEVLQDKFNSYCQTSFGEEDIIDFKNFVIEQILFPDHLASEGMKEYVKEVLNVIGSILKVDLLTFMTRIEKTALSFTGTPDGESPVALPHDLEVRDNGPVLVRINKPDGHPDLANGSLLKFIKIAQVPKGEVAILQDESNPPNNYKISKVMRYAMDGQKMYVTFQFPFISADASTTHKIQGTSLNYAGFLLDGSYRQRHSHYVAISRVKDPRKFIYLCKSEDLKGLPPVKDIDHAITPDVQTARLKKIFKKVRGLVSVHQKTYDTVMSWENAE